MKNIRLIDVPAGRGYDPKNLMMSRHSFFVGRNHDDCDLPLGEGLTLSKKLELRLDKVSKTHVIVNYDVQKDSFYIRDDSSTNGTFLNGKLLEQGEEYLIRPGDKIFFGPEGEGYGPVRIEEVRPAVRE